jgi:hypothetical protein
LVALGDLRLQQSNSRAIARATKSKRAGMPVSPMTRTATARHLRLGAAEEKDTFVAFCRQRLWLFPQHNDLQRQ